MKCSRLWCSSNTHNSNRMRALENEGLLQACISLTGKYVCLNAFIMYVCEVKLLKLVVYLFYIIMTNKQDMLNNHFQMGFKAHFTGDNTCQVLKIWPRAHGWEIHKSQGWTYHYYFEYYMNILNYPLDIYPYIHAAILSKRFLCALDCN